MRCLAVVDSQAHPPTGSGIPNHMPHPPHSPGFNSAIDLEKQDYIGRAEVSLHELVYSDTRSVELPLSSTLAWLAGHLAVLCRCC